MDFLRVEQSVRELKRQVTTGEIDQGVFETRLLALIDLADDGYYWMFGHKTGMWYRHDGQQWVPDNPGEILAILPETPMSAPKPKTLNHQSISYLHNSHKPEEAPPEVDWSSVDWDWFLAALALLVFIGVVVYLASLGSL